MLSEFDPADDLPTGLRAFHLLAVRRFLTASVREAVFAMMRERGELWVCKGQPARVDNTLTTEQAFDHTLHLFLERVPAAREGIDQKRAEVEATRAAVKRPRR